MRQMLSLWTSKDQSLRLSWNAPISRLAQRLSSPFEEGEFGRPGSPADHAQELICEKWGHCEASCIIGYTSGSQSLQGHAWLSVFAPADDLFEGFVGYEIGRLEGS